MEGLVKVRKIELEFMLEKKMKIVKGVVKEVLSLDDVVINNDGVSKISFEPVAGKGLFFKDLFYDTDSSNLPIVDGGGGGKIIISTDIDGKKGIIIAGFNYSARFYIPC